MCRHATMGLPPVPASAGAARRFVADAAQRWDLLPLLEDAELALTELVTNAILHAATPISISISCAPDGMEIAVFDGSPALPATRPSGDIGRDPTDSRLHVREAGAAARGRGLVMVAALAAQWGVSPLSDGKAVWVRMAAPDPWPHGVGCACASADALGRVPLASGRHVVHRG